MGVPLPAKSDNQPTATTTTSAAQTASVQPAVTPLPVSVAEKMYEEAIELEYAKREGGA
jgi:hypothetical protein